MDPEAEKRLDRFESKLDQVNDKLGAFPVVGQRISDIERRIGFVEREVHELNNRVGGNAMQLAKLGGIFTIIAFVATMVAREMFKRM